MALSRILNPFAAPNKRRQRKAFSAAAIQAEVFETKQMLSTTALFLPATGEVSIELNTIDNVRITSVNGNVSVQVSSGGGAFVPVNSLGTVPASSVVSINVLGNDEANTIDLSGVTSAAFTSLTSIRVDGANGDDLLIGSPDFGDSLIGGHGNDTLQGQGGNDTLVGGDGADSIEAGAGDDSITAGDGDDVVLGDDGNDTVAAGNGQDTVSGGNGNDSLEGANGQDSLSGDAGDDTINGDGGTDTINGGSGNDLIFGGELNDSLLGGDGNDTINGQSGDDFIAGEAGDDSLVGGNGNDQMDGGLNNDTLNGNLGNDSMTGGDGDDSLQGGAGRDLLDGGFGNDRVFGQSGNDTLIGGGDSDLLDGGEGNDSVNSGDVVATGLPRLSISDATVTEGDSLFSTLFNAANDVPVTDDNPYIVAADFDNDGDIDLATAASILLNDGTGLFAPAVATGSTAQGRMDSGDVDGDGDIDIVISGNSSGDIDLLINNGDGTFQAPVSAVDLGTFFGSSSVVLADVDGDGDLDLSAVIGFATSEVFVSLNNGNGTFQPPQQFAAGTNGASDLVAGDFDGDGDIDIVVAKVFFQANVAFLRNNGNGTFQAGVLTAVNSQPSAIVAADFDNDGDLDIATSGATDTVLLNNGTGGFTASGPIANTGFFQSPNDIAAADLDGDGDIDLALVAFSGQITLLENNGAGVFLAAGPAALSTNQGFGDSLVLADLTGDGAPEIAVNDGFAQNNVSVLRNTGATRQTAAFTVTLSAPSSLPVTVSFATANGFAVAGSDYQPLSGTLVFAPGTTSQTIRVTLEGDNIPEPTENFFVNLSNPTNATLDDAQGQGLILDNDGAPAGPTMSITNASVTEGNTGTVTVSVDVTLSAPVATPVSVQFNTVSGTATAGSDFVPVSGTLTFPPGVTMRRINVQVNGDLRNEGNENFFIDLSNPIGVPLFNSRSVITITDNDGAIPVSSPNDTLRGGGGDDVLTGSIGDDVLLGQGGNDSILGGDGNDFLAGGSGTDTLDGQAGDDTLDGQGGNDFLIGGLGNDTFTLGNGAGGTDFADDNDGLNQIIVNGTNSAETLIVGQNAGRLAVTRGTATIIANTNSSVQAVIVNALGGDDTVTVQDLSSINCAALVVVNGGEGNDLITGQGSKLGLIRLSLNGDGGNDTIVGSEGSDSINGGAGNDAVNGRAGNDAIMGGDGNDTLAGSLGNDTINAGNGNDFVTGNEGEDSLIGGDGNDTLRGMDGNDTLLGVAGDDVLNGMDGDDLILGGVGQDQISGGAGHDTLDGGRNNDTVNGNSGDDLIRGDHGNDLLNAGNGNNTVIGGDGNDTIISAEGNDLITGSDGDDVINSDGGDDTVIGGDGNDTIQAGSGNDIVLGGDGDDVLNGQGGTDIISGGQGIDTIADPPSEINESFVLPASVLALLN